MSIFYSLVHDELQGAEGKDEQNSETSRQTDSKLILPIAHSKFSILRLYPMYRPT